MLKQRVITAVILIAILAGATILSKYALIVIACICAVGGAYEYSRLITKNNKIGANLLLCTASALTIVISVFSDRYIFEIALLSILVIFMLSIFSKEPDAMDIIFLVWGYIYTGLFMALAVRVILHPYGYYIILPAIAACALCDTAAYFIGCSFGKHRLAPKVSPKKSIEGAVAGFTAAVITYSLSYFISAKAGIEIPLMFFILGGVVVGIVGQCGDLAASLVKRKFDVKDYGTVFPGHGGFLDRIDSYLFVFAAMYILCKIVIKL